MTLDDIGRSAARDLRAATGRARFTVRAPGEARRRWVLGLAAVAAIAILAPVAWMIGSRDRPVAGPPAVASPTTVEELVVAVYRALRNQDDAALAGLAMPNARHGSYLVLGGIGETPTLAPGASYLYRDPGLTKAGPVLVEMTGPAMIVGEAVAVPVQYLYPDRVMRGFDLYVLTTAPAGPRIRGGASFLGEYELAPDPGASGRIAEYIAAWNSGVPSSVMSFIGEGAVMWDDVGTGDPARAYVGDRLNAFIATSLWFDVTMTAPAVASGPFLAVPNRLITPSDTAEGISVLLIHDGLIYLHAFAQ